jgi:hypothetical protein
MVGEVPDAQLVVEREGDAWMGSAGAVALGSGEELGRAGKELLDILLAQYSRRGGHYCRPKS